MAIREEATRIMPLPGVIQVKFNDGRCTILIDGEPYAYRHMTAKDVKVEIGPDRIPRLHVALMAQTVMVTYEEEEYTWENEDKVRRTYKMGRMDKVRRTYKVYDKFGYPMGEEEAKPCGHDDAGYAHSDELDYGPQFGEEEDE